MFSMPVPFTTQNWLRWFRQLVVALLVVSGVALVCHWLQAWLDYRVTALVLLVCVSLCSFFMEILPLLCLAVSSGLVLNYFFIPPLYTLHIENAEDSLLFFMYVIVALIHAVFSKRIRAAEAAARDKEEKEKAIELYNTLLNSLSHEMRTPLATLVGAADTLSDPGSNLREQDKQRLYEVIAESGMRLNRQVDNLLNMSRMEAGMLQLKLDWCDINELIQTCLEKNIPAEQRFRVHFASNPGMPFYFLDAGLMEQVIVNLLHNALQYAGERARIDIVVHAAEEGLVVRVADDGVGLGQVEMERIFEKFYRRPGNNAAGTGLGLSIARGIAAAHGGTLEVAARKPKGLIFTLSVPSRTSHINKLKHE